MAEDFYGGFAVVWGMLLQMKIFGVPILYLGLGSIVLGAIVLFIKGEKS